uniref:F-box domain-containing protein n=1 Tax=Ditylenchus dipsaci TaxID=166011 RepID=A0A915D2Q4_9BILA
MQHRCSRAMYLCQINELPIEILAEIFEHLNYRQRVQIERFTRNTLCLKEPWNNLEPHYKTEKLTLEEENPKKYFSMYISESFRQ